MSDPIEFMGAPLGGAASESGIATVFPAARVVVTLAGIHATQHFAYTERIHESRLASGLPPLTRAEEEELSAGGVDLIMKGGITFIRPNADDMGRAFAADALLQEIIPKRRIRFLLVGDRRVQQALRSRGECWRMAGRPRTPEEIERLILGAKIRIGGDAIYYYSLVTGARHLTCQALAGLAALDDAALLFHVREIEAYFGKRNRRGYREVTFFGASESFLEEVGDLLKRAVVAPSALRERHRELSERLQDAVPRALRRDDVRDLEWRRRMFRELVPDGESDVEEILEGIGSEFFLQVQWLPGGRIEQGELIFDSLFEGDAAAPRGDAPDPPVDLRARDFIMNYLREFSDLEYVNIGGLATTLRRRNAAGGHRAYIAEIKHQGRPTPIVRVIRMQKWGIAEHLDDGAEFIAAVFEAEYYTEYILNRRLGCRQLGMLVPARFMVRRLWEEYRGRRAEHIGTRIWRAYFERDYIPGMATDKIPDDRLGDIRFAERLADLLGRAAALNMIVGRTTRDERTGLDLAHFDDGDEVLALDAEGMPAEIVVADHVDTFANFESPLARVAPDYAAPVTSRRARVKDPARFAQIYLDALTGRLRRAQDECRRRRRAFDDLFRYSRQGRGTFSHRWRCVLDRLEATDIDEIRRLIAEPLAA